MVVNCPNCGKSLGAPDRKSRNKFFYIEFYTCDSCGLRFEIVVHLDSGVFKVDSEDKKDLAMFRRCVLRVAEPVESAPPLWDTPLCAANA
jgi:C4-type Zn-finger protein